MVNENEIIQQFLNPHPSEPWFTLDGNGEFGEFVPITFTDAALIPFEVEASLVTWDHPSMWSQIPWSVSPATDDRPEPKGKAEVFQRAAAVVHEEVEHSIVSAGEPWQLRVVAERQRERRILAMVSRYFRAIESGVAEPTDDYEKMQEIAG